MSQQQFFPARIKVFDNDEEKMKRKYVSGTHITLVHGYITKLIHTYGSDKILENAKNICLYWKVEYFIR